MVLPIHVATVEKKRKQKKEEHVREVYINIDFYKVIIY